MKLLGAGVQAFVFSHNRKTYMITKSPLKIKYLTAFKLGILLGKMKNPYREDRYLSVLKVPRMKKLSGEESWNLIGDDNINKLYKLFSKGQLYPDIESLNKFLRTLKPDSFSLDLSPDNIMKYKDKFVLIDPLIDETDKWDIEFYDYSKLQEGLERFLNCNLK